jgi:hypothetical protein
MFQESILTWSWVILCLFPAALSWFIYMPILIHRRHSRTIIVMIRYGKSASIFGCIAFSIVTTILVVTVMFSEHQRFMESFESIVKRNVPRDLSFSSKRTIKDILLHHKKKSINKLYDLVRRNATARDPDVIALVRELMDPPSDHMVKIVRPVVSTPQSQEVVNLLKSKVRNVLPILMIQICIIRNIHSYYNIIICASHVLLMNNSTSFLSPSGLLCRYIHWQFKVPFSWIN